jgi:hypothetical protein
MPQPTANEQYLLELINRDRAKVGAQPLAFDSDLNEAADAHTQWMLATDQFSHTGSGGSSPTQRIKDAGYSLSGSWSTGENIAWASTRQPAGNQDEIELLHKNLMNSPGHKANILNANFKEVGIGFDVGTYKQYQGAFVSEDFAKTTGNPILTGVVFDDKDSDKFYDPNEALGGITVTARNVATGQTTATTAGQSGGYDIALGAGSYEVTFSGGGITPVKKSVTIGTKNVKLDLVDPAFGGSTTGPVSSAPDQTPTTPTAPATPATPPVRGSAGTRKYADAVEKKGWLAGTKGVTDSGEADGRAGDMFHFKTAFAKIAVLDDIAAPGRLAPGDLVSTDWSSHVDPAILKTLGDLVHAESPDSGTQHHDDAAAALAKLAQILGHAADV